MLANLRALFGVIVDIILLRRGPEQLPASTAQLAFVVALSVVGTALLATAVSPLSLLAALLQVLVASGVMLLWFRVALNIAKKDERYLQTMTALFGVNTLFVPVMVPLLGALAPYVQKADPNVPPSGALLVVILFVVVWLTVVELRIVKAAFELPWIAAFLLLMGEGFTSLLVMSLLFGS